MLKNLPLELQQKLARQLGNDFDAFGSAMEDSRVTGLRANTIKMSASQLEQKLPYLMSNIPWCRDGYYYDESSVRPAKSPYYYAGLYYIQEPSAMLPVELLDVQPGQNVLDICAAPGGKSIQLAGRMQGNGLLVSNDIHPQRAKALLKNIERYGVVNAIVTNESPEKLSQVFSKFFDKILVDAPCSGEGMFRREPSMAKEWSHQEQMKYIKWQKEILSYIPAMLRNSGELVYSTCTFSQEENEDQINNYISQFSGYTLVKSQRIWPHLQQGEGHFAAHIASLDHRNTNSFDMTATINELKLSKATYQAINDFSLQVWDDENTWQKWLPQGGNIVERSDHILWESRGLPSLKGLKILRSGWLLGLMHKGRFKPSQAYALGLPKAAILATSRRYDFQDHNYSESVRYLRGETIGVDKDLRNGWYLVTIDGFALGWAKGSSHGLKNEYPPGWRWED